MQTGLFSVFCLHGLSKSDILSIYSSNANIRYEFESSKSEEFDIDYATERRGQYDYRPDYTDKH